jgi:RHS repeat-associated protein
MTYPLNVPPYSSSSPTAVNYGRDQMGRLNGMTDVNLGGTLVNGVSYNAADQMLTISSGVSGSWPLGETRTYNVLNQLTGIRDVNPDTGQVQMNLVYNYSPTANNGRIASKQNLISGEQVVYTYDAVNRLATAATAANPNVTQWGLQFGYDGFGNLLSKTATAGSPPTLSMTVDASTNRLNDGNQTMQYDNNGNVTTMNILGTMTNLTWDVENRLIGADTNVRASYGYDPRNRRIFEGGVFWVYDEAGRRIGKFGVVGPAPYTIYYMEQHLYFAGKEVTLGGAPEDRLGSIGGYYPYGEAMGGGGEKFATYPHDANLNLEYGLNRYYSAAMGRFLSPDPAANNVGISNPETWNRYSYVMNDPVNYNDAPGLYAQGVGAGLGGGGADWGWDPYITLPDNTCFAAFFSLTHSYASPAAQSVLQQCIQAQSLIPVSVGGSGGGRQSTVDAAKNKLEGAELTAINALGNHECGDLFGLSDVMNAFDAFLKTISFADHSKSWGIAITKPATIFGAIQYIISGIGSNTVTIINANPGGQNQQFWNESNDTVNAETLLHEFGHYVEFHYGRGTASVGHGRGRASSWDEDDTLFHDCFGMGNPNPRP